MNADSTLRVWSECLGIIGITLGVCAAWGGFVYIVATTLKGA